MTNNPGGTLYPAGEVSPSTNQKERHTMKNIIRIVIAILMASMLSGCLGPLMAGGALIKATIENRAAFSLAPVVVMAGVHKIMGNSTAQRKFTTSATDAAPVVAVAAAK